MNHIYTIAEMLTDDPDVFHQTVVIAVHPDHVIDASAAAASVYGEQPEIYGPHRLAILKSYIDKFKKFMLKQKANGAKIVITLMGKPSQLEGWYDKKAHWKVKRIPKAGGGYKYDESNVDHVKMGMEQEEVGQLHQDLIDFINQLSVDPNVDVVSEEGAGAACNRGELNHILKDADEILVIGGNLTGCLENTVRFLAKHPNGPKTKIVNELTFDDDSGFWKRHLPSGLPVS